MSAFSSIATACTFAWNSSDLSSCTPLGLDISTWLAAGTAIVGVAVFGGKALLNMRGKGNDKPPVIKAGQFRSKFSKICCAIKPLMDENYRIFRGFGPNGGIADGRPKNVRMDLGIWYGLRAKIVENNSKIREIITANLDGIPAEHRPVFIRWLNHIDAFQAHIDDEAADYSNNQFPGEVSEIISRHD
jgi:hypothetical protein